MAGNETPGLMLPAGSGSGPSDDETAAVGVMNPLDPVEPMPAAVFVVVARGVGVGCWVERTGDGVAEGVAWAATTMA